MDGELSKGKRTTTAWNTGSALYVLVFFCFFILKRICGTDDTLIGRKSVLLFIQAMSSEGSKRAMRVAKASDFRHFEARCAPSCRDTCFSLVQLQLLLHSIQSYCLHDG